MKSILIISQQQGRTQNMPYFNREDKEKLEEKLKKVYELPDFYNDGDDDDNDDWDDEIYND